MYFNSNYKSFCVKFKELRVYGGYLGIQKR